MGRRGMTVITDANEYSGAGSEDVSRMDVDGEESVSFFVRALYDFSSEDSSSLSFRKGALIEVLTQLESGWWDGLLGNDVRGWFPSNYVEIISDEEAERELRARAQHLMQKSAEAQGTAKSASASTATSSSLSASSEANMLNHQGSGGSSGTLDYSSLSAISTSGFDGLGLGRDLDTLRALMSGEGLSSSGHGDAFEELAEAAMSSGKHHSGRRSRNGSRTRRENGRGGGGSGDDANGAGSSEGEQDSSSTTTIEDRLSAGERSRVQSRNGSLSKRGNARNGESRRQSISQEALNSRASSVQHRPRAATDLGTRLGMPGATSRDQPVEEYGTPNTHVSSSDEDGAWTAAGTSAVASPPSAAGLSASLVRPLKVTRRLPDDDRHASPNLTHPPDSLCTRQSRSNTTESNTSKLSSGLISIGSKATSSTTGTLPSMLDVPPGNAIDYLPADAGDIKYPWLVRLTDDEQTFFYYNIDTKETRWDLPSASATGSDAKKFDATTASFRDSIRRPSAITLGSFESDDSDADSLLHNLRAPGKSPHKLLAAQGARSGMAAAPYAAIGSAGKRLAEPKALLDAPPALLKEAEQAASLQYALQPRENLVVLLAGLQESMAESMSKVMSIISEFGTRSKTEGDLVGAELSSAVASTLQSVRALLYSAGGMALTPEDLENVTDYDISNTTYAHCFPAPDLALAQYIVGPQISALNNSADTKTQSPKLIQPSLKGTSRKVIQSLSKLILSSRTLIEFNKLDAAHTPVDLESAQILVYRMEQRRQRVREDATDLLRAASTLSAELDKHRGAAAQTGSSLNWPRRLDGILKSGEGAAGVGPESLSGGSAASWRGSGFVLPSARETAALRADAIGHFTNPFDLTPETRSLLQSGRTALRRRPNQQLSPRNVAEVLQPQHDDLRLQFLGLRNLLRTGSLTASTPERSETPKPLNHEQSLADNRIDSPPLSSDLLGQAEVVLQRVGTYLGLLEDIDLASTLDFDGPGKTGLDPSDLSDNLVLKARTLAQEFAQAKQDLFDAASEILVDAQDAVSSTFKATIEQETAQGILNRVDALLLSSGDVQDLLQQLLQVATEQQSCGHAKIGARAKVYGVVDLPAPALSAAASTEQLTEASVDDGAAGDDGRGGVLYSGPGVAGPDKSPGDNRYLASRPSLANRGRSSSTAASALANRRKDSQGLDKDGDFKSPLSDKIKKFFGDEPSSKELEATATAKRVEADPWFLEVDYSPDDIVMNSDGQVKGATLGALMERLTMHKNFDANFNNTFLLTYRSFTTTHELLDLLFARFRIAIPSSLSALEQEMWVEKKQQPIQLRVFNVLKSWLETYLYEGEDEKYLERIRRFAENEMAATPSMALASKQLVRLIERRRGDGEMQVRKMVMPNSAPPPVLPKNLRKIKFLDIDPLEMARQLTLLDSTLFCRIKPFECLDKSWSKKDADKLAPGIKDTINTSNRITGWVAEAILMQEDLKKRALWVRQFIAIADRCRALQNFSTMTAIVSGLNSAPVYRLRRTWDQVNQKHVTVLESLNKVMQSSKNFADYREMIHKLNPPCVPFLGVYLTDLTFIEDGNPDRLKTDERLINFGKRQKTAEVVKEIMIYQSTPFNLTTVPGIQKFINDNLVDTRSDNDLYQQSLLLEPRERDDEKIARLLQESGFL
ncbi:hypothetical protein K437DRAFT_107336 [Tilletiaria anomala UBC 951]|uniref:Ras GEF n=1 Tax=Tilletiaria anomala (strain ATCC 24038 / CBS 436.72 / UBC 951) TaxID=1037660 RepID=A0A066W6Q6_TILAU|nr:uncharacterized protein K437DRAFT_107336 [Tilletiaria anomala UBC 951]KDN46450.1 hypothetical protein K437DRAFT_107336 [Tilletiaria anomala UBC 951]